MIVPAGDEAPATPRSRRGRPLHPMPRSLRFTLLGVVWLAAVVRLRGLFANTFHADEALFAGWARLIAIWRDPLLLTQPVDKPPLLFYSQAVFYPLFGPVEWAARLPSLVASLLLVVLVGLMAWRLGGDSVAAGIAATVMAVAPLAVQFSATAFSDPLLTFWLAAAIVFLLAPRGRALPGLVGLCFGLALATKYQAALFLPLLAGLAWLTNWRGREWARAAGASAVVGVLLLLWGAARGDDAGLIAHQWTNIGGLRLARSWEVGPRLVEQTRLWQLALGWPLLAAALASFVVVGLWPRARKRLTAADALLALFVLGYVLLHWLWAVPAWDRYLLPILPIVATLTGRAAAAVYHAGRERAASGQRALVGLAIVIAGLHLLPLTAARAGQYPIGGRPVADGGAAVVARALADAPYGTVLYDHWYSWHWRYQLFDRRVFVSWFPHADALLADLAAFGRAGPARYIALPRDATAAPLHRRLSEAGYRLVEVASPAGASMGLWRIESEESDE